LRSSANVHEGNEIDWLSIALSSGMLAGAGNGIADLVKAASEPGAREQW
jgi:hypothetical protein